MDVFNDYLRKMPDDQKRSKLVEIFDWIEQTFPNLKKKYAWNQPMFVDGDTFIIGFSYATNHIAIAPEKYAMTAFKQEIEQSGYSYSSHIFRIKWNEAVNYPLLEKIINFKIVDKEGSKLFWKP